jgi:prefoldin alpha subunit
MEKELEEKIVAYRILEARLDGLLKQRDMVVSKMIELDTTLKTMDDIEKSEEVLFPLGSEAYTFGKVTDKKKMIVEIGSGIALEKTVEEAKEIIKKRRSELENILNNVQSEVMQVSSSLDVLGPEIRELSEKEG